MAITPLSTGYRSASADENTSHIGEHSKEAPQKVDAWLKDRIAYIKALKAPSDLQSLLALLAEKTDRTPSEEKKLLALIRAEKATIRASTARQKAAKLIADSDKKAQAEERKARNHRLILQGVLVDLAGLQNRSRGEILGLLLAGAATGDEQKWAAWKTRGDSLLAEKSGDVDKILK